MTSTSSPLAVMATSILFVDDEPDFEALLRLNYRRQLRSGEIDFEVARDGEEALRKLDARSFDLIATDINMPTMGGLELLRELRRRGLQTPVVVMSAYTNSANIHGARAAGAFDYLTKPIDFEAFDRLRIRAASIRASPPDRAESPGPDDELSSLGFLVAGVVHELKNPLSFISTFAKLSSGLLDELDAALDDGDLDRAREQLADLKLTTSKIIRHGDWGLRIVSSILEGTGNSAGELDVNALISDYIELFSASMRVEHPTLDVNIDKQLDASVTTIAITPQELVRVLIALLENAYHALLERDREDATFTAQIWIETRAHEERVELCVADNGPGIPAELREQIFTAFFTTKGAREGSGLGLHVINQIVCARGGWVRAEANEPCGARLRVCVPAR